MYPNRHCVVRPPHCHPHYYILLFSSSNITSNQVIINLFLFLALYPYVLFQEFPKAFTCSLLKIACCTSAMLADDYRNNRGHLGFIRSYLQHRYYVCSVGVRVCTCEHALSPPPWLQLGSLKFQESRRLILVFHFSGEASWLHSNLRLLGFGKA